MVVDELVDPNLSTFTPLEQEVHSNIKYIGMGYMPCNGYVPCQVIMTRRYLYCIINSHIYSRPTCSRTSSWRG